MQHVMQMKGQGQNSLMPKVNSNSVPEMASEGGRMWLPLRSADVSSRSLTRGVSFALVTLLLPGRQALSLLGPVFRHRDSCFQEAAP